MQGLRHVESFAIRFLAGQAAVASLAGTRLRTTRSPRPGQPAPLLQRCRARNTETHHRLRLTHPTVNHSPRCGDLGLIVVCSLFSSHGKKPAPPDHAVHLLPLSHSLGRHTKPPGGQTIATSPLKHLHRLLPKQTIMPQPQIHRHEKPPIPWTSISMSKKREAVQNQGRGRSYQSASSAQYERHSHSMVAGGLEVTSRTTRLTSGTELVMRVEMRARTS